MKDRWIALFVLILAFAAGAKADGIELPSTPVGKAASGFFKVLNSGDSKAVTEFISKNFAEDALSKSPAAERTSLFIRLFRQSGGVEPMILSPDSNERFLVVEVKSIRGDHWGRMFFVMNRSSTPQLIDIGVFGVRDPREVKAEAWPEIKMTEKAALKEIALRTERESAADRFSGVVVIAKGDSVVFERAFGLADKGLAVRNRVDTKFNLGSMNKMFTATAIAQLVEAGKLSFDDTVAKVLPEYPNKAASEKITIRHLLTHTSGLGDFFDNPDFRPFRQKYQSPRDYFPLFAAAPLRFEPGARFGYSNAGFVLLGAIVEKVSGQDYFEYIRNHIYKCASMVNSDSYELTEVVPNLAIGYGRFDDDPLGIDPRRSNVAFLPWKGSPAGGGYSTTRDIMGFIRALRTDKLVNAKMREMLISTKTPMTGSYRPGGYGFGFVTEEYSGKTAFGHGGGGANSGINSNMKAFSDGSYTIIVMSNYDSPAADDLCYEITRLLARI